MIVPSERLLARLGANHALPRYSVPPHASRSVRARKSPVSASFNSTAASHSAVPVSGISACSRQRSSADETRRSTEAHCRQQCVYPGLRTCRKHPSRGHGGAGFLDPRRGRLVLGPAAELLCPSMGEAPPTLALRGAVITRHHSPHAVDDSVDLQNSDPAVAPGDCRDLLNGKVIDYDNLDIVRLLARLDVLDRWQRRGIRTSIATLPQCPTFL